MKGLGILEKEAKENKRKNDVQKNEKKKKKKKFEKSKTMNLMRIKMWREKNVEEEKSFINSISTSFVFAHIQWAMIHFAMIEKCDYCRYNDPTE